MSITTKLTTTAQSVSNNLKKSPAHQFSLAIILTILGVWGGTFLVTNGYDDVKLEAAKKRTEIFNTYCTIFGAAVTASLGFRQYKNDKKDKQTLFIASEIKEFESKLETVNVTQMLVDELRIVKLFPDADKAKNRTVIVTDDKLKEALEVPLKPLKINEDTDSSRKDDDAYVYAAIRDNFDRFLNHLERFYNMRESGVFNSSDFEAYLSPCIKMIDDADDRSTIKNQIEIYIRNQEYNGVLQLLKEYREKQEQHQSKQNASFKSKFDSLQLFFESIASTL
ncbi:MAG: hypothetical protein MUE44_36955 [Oscillatoriaceae cyanobacterium Prado104]|jgi:hypothetical protein|nr:hypothetical protein [Oscillatoriaceae cyanobacterium Prado104]